MYIPIPQRELTRNSVKSRLTESQITVKTHWSSEQNLFYWLDNASEFA